MAKKRIPQSEFDEIIQAISLHPEGIQFENLRRILKINFPRRILQYRLNSLVKKGS